LLAAKQRPEYRKENVKTMSHRDSARYRTKNANLKNAMLLSNAFDFCFFASTIASRVIAFPERFY